MKENHSACLQSQLQSTVSEPFWEGRQPLAFSRLASCSFRKVTPFEPMAHTDIDAWMMRWWYMHRRVCGCDEHDWPSAYCVRANEIWSLKKINHECFRNGQCSGVYVYTHIYTYNYIGWSMPDHTLVFSCRFVASAVDRRVVYWHGRFCTPEVHEGGSWVWEWQMNVSVPVAAYNTLSAYSRLALIHKRVDDDGAQEKSGARAVLGGRHCQHQLHRISGGRHVRAA